MTDIANFALSIAREAGALVVEERNSTTMSREFKHGLELVTSADLKADQLIRDRITAQYPAHYILSEESSPDLGNVQTLDAPVWIIDPIDGTVNFSHGHNQSAISIAYVVHAGGSNFLLPMMLGVTAITLLYFMKANVSALRLGTGLLQAGFVGFLLSVSKISAAIAFVRWFPRDSRRRQRLASEACPSAVSGRNNRKWKGR